MFIFKLNKHFLNESTFKLISNNLKSFNRYLAKEPEYPPLNENEIRELFVKGTGPGGQKVNKATNRCELKHLPTGIVVSSHHTRSLEENRKIARKLLQQKLDIHYNKENSHFMKKQQEKRE